MRFAFIGFGSVFYGFYTRWMHEFDVCMGFRGFRCMNCMWLWDFDARPLTKEDKVKLADKTTKGRTGFSLKLYKTASFLATQPYGTIPAAFSPDGKIGIFESRASKISICIFFDFFVLALAQNCIFLVLFFMFISRIYSFFHS